MISGRSGLSVAHNAGQPAFHPTKILPKVTIINVITCFYRIEFKILAQLT
jgi:hypothetical protein